MAREFDVKSEHLYNGLEFLNECLITANSMGLNIDLVINNNGDTFIHFTLNEIKNTYRSEITLDWCEVFDKEYMSELKTKLDKIIKVVNKIRE